MIDKMKKVFLTIILFLSIHCIACNGEDHEHEWIEANCEEPKTCAICSITEGNALGHQFDNGHDDHCNAEGCEFTRETIKRHFDYTGDRICDADGCGYRFSNQASNDGFNLPIDPN